MLRMKYLIGALVIAGLFATSTPAQARKVFLNGVNLSAVDLPAVSLKGCDVHIDAKGNIQPEGAG